MENLERIMTEFSVTVYGDLEKYNDVTSRARCRTFYKGANRNGTYITDEFAEQLLSTIPYTPVKGIYEDDDYTDHGDKRSLGRIYGIVPQDPHLQWEKHLDEDGIEREYACVDVLLFTAIYKEANEIIGKSQSMEIYDKSIDGNWQIINGQKYFVFNKGCFLGLQVLGEEVEPCFEGASFFTLYESLNQMIQRIEEYNSNIPNYSQGGNKMPEFNYKLSDNQKAMALWNLLNENFNEAGNWTIEYDICDVYDEYAVVKNYIDNCFERVYYSKDDATDSLSITAKKKCYIVDVTESEKNALETIQALNQGSYEKIDETFNTLTEEKTEFEHKNAELNETIVTLTTERDNFNAQFNEANDLLNEAKTSLETAKSEYATLQAERDELFNFKEGIDKQAKEAIIASYSETLSQEVLDDFSAKIGDFTAEELDMKLAYELKKSNPSIFTKEPQAQFIPKDNTQKSGLEELLSKYANKN